MFVLGRPFTTGFALSSDDVFFGAFVLGRPFDFALSDCTLSLGVFVLGRPFGFALNGAITFLGAFGLVMCFPDFFAGMLCVERFSRAQAIEPSSALVVGARLGMLAHAPVFCLVGRADAEGSEAKIIAKRTFKCIEMRTIFCKGMVQGVSNRVSD